MFIFALIPLILILCALGDIIVREDGQVKHLPKLTWVFIVILLPLVGSILWFAVGREYSRPADLGTFGDRRRWDRTVTTTEAPAPRRALGSTEEQLAALDAEIEHYERQARIRRMQEELEAKRKVDGAS